MFTKNAVVKSFNQLRVIYPNISFTLQTPYELGWADYVAPPYVPTQEELDRQAAFAALEADKTDALAYNKLTALSNMTPAQIQTWVDGNVTNLATAQDAIKTLAVGLSILIRREKLSRL